MAAVTYLLDTNVFLELLLEQERAEDVRSLFATLEPESYVISDFSLHSIGVILARMDRHDLLLEFIDDLIVETGMRVMGVPSPNLPEVVALILRHRLDFDDAYQLAVAERYSLRLVSFDRHLDAAPSGRLEPVDVLERAG